MSAACFLLVGYTAPIWYYSSLLSCKPVVWWQWTRVIIRVWGVRKYLLKNNDMGASRTLQLHHGISRSAVQATSQSMAFLMILLFACVLIFSSFFRATSALLWFVDCVRPVVVGNRVGTDLPSADRKYVVGSVYLTVPSAYMELCTK